MRHLVTLLALFPLFGLLVVAPSQEAFGHTIVLFQHSTQEPHNVGRGAGGENGVFTLEPGMTNRHEMGGGQRRTYRVRLAADQFLKAVIEQDGIDVVAHLSGQDCERIMDFDTESRLRGQESVRQVAEVGCDYRLVVEPKLKEAPAGSYEIRIEELRAATENDRALQEARNLYREATDLRDAGKYDGAIPSYERAPEISERVLEPYPPDVATPINGLAILYYHEGEYAKAESLRQRALAIWEKALGLEHPNVAESLNSLADLRSNTDDYAKDAESQHESVGEKLISEEQALIESHLVKCNHCRGVIEFAAESESKGLLSLYLIPAGNKIKLFSKRTYLIAERKYSGVWRKFSDLNCLPSWCEWSRQLSCLITPSERRISN